MDMTRIMINKLEHYNQEAPGKHACAWRDARKFACCKGRRTDAGYETHNEADGRQPFPEAHVRIEYAYCYRLTTCDIWRSMAWQSSMQVESTLSHASVARAATHVPRLPPRCFHLKLQCCPCCMSTRRSQLRATRVTCALRSQATNSSVCRSST